MRYVVLAIDGLDGHDYILPSAVGLAEHCERLELVNRARGREVSLVDLEAGLDINQLEDLRIE